MKENKCQIVLFIILIIISIILLFTYTIPYMRADFESKQAIIEMNNKLKAENSTNENKT